MIIAITGASGVGKTTVVKEVTKTLPDSVKVFHFDDIGMPDWSKVDAKKWQEKTTHQWIDKIVQIAREENVDVLFEGSTEIQFYIDAFAKNNYSDYSLLLFDCETATMKNRLIGRGQPELYHEHMVNWLNYLRRDAQQKDIEIIKTNQHSVEEISQILIKKINMSSVQKQMANRFREVVLDGKWIANTNIKLQVSDLTWEQANQKVASLNTIAALVFHLHYYIAGVSRFFEGNRLDISDKHSFDLSLIQSQEDWEKLQNQLWIDTERFAQLVEQMPDEQLEKVFLHEKYGNYRRNIEGMTEHCYYHLGQMVLIKKMILNSIT